MDYCRWEILKNFIWIWNFWEILVLELLNFVSKLKFSQNFTSTVIPGLLYWKNFFSNFFKGITFRDGPRDGSRSISGQKQVIKWANRPRFSEIEKIRRGLEKTGTRFVFVAKTTRKLIFFRFKPPEICFFFVFRPFFGDFWKKKLCCKSAPMRIIYFFKIFKIFFKNFLWFPVSPKHLINFCQ